MKNLNNPVARLLNILRDLEKKTAGDGDTVGKILVRVFNLNDANFSQQLTVYLELVVLTKESMKMVERLLPESVDLHMRALKRIETCLGSYNLQANWASFKKYLDPATMTGLEHTADVLSYKVKEQVVSEQDLQRLQRELNELMELIIQSDIDEELRAFLIGNVERIQSAILYYRIRGTKGLEEALERIIGSSAIFDWDDGKKPPSTDLKTKIGSVFTLLAKIVAVGNDLKGFTGIDIFQLPRLLP